MNAIRAQGAGGQNVKKMSSAVHLHFNVAQSSLSDEFKEKLFNFNDQKISKDGIIVVKAQKFRSQEKNRADSLERLQELIVAACTVQKKAKTDQTYTRISKAKS